jgi:hypothetical protein
MMNEYYDSKLNDRMENDRIIRLLKDVQRRRYKLKQGFMEGL